MAVVGEAFIALRAGDADGFVRDANGRLRDAKGKFVKAGEQAGEGFSTGFGRETQGRMLSSAKSLAGKIALTLGGAYAIRTGVDQVTKALAAADESRKIGAQTEAVIKSTGAAANVSAEQVGKLASALSLKTGIDDEAIQQGQNLLLTFTNIRNEAGKGNDVFDQSSKTLLDLATAMGTEPKAAAVQLGKALNDPTKGITALTRVGVTFTDQQKAQIQALQASGDVMGAQKIILAELNKEFGGSAEAQASAIDKMKVALGNLQETFGAAILPAVEKLLPALQVALDAIAPVLEQLGGIIGTVLGALGPSLQTLGAIVGQALGPIGDALTALAPAVQPLIAALGTVVLAFAPLLPVVSQVFSSIVQAIAPVIKTLGANLGPIIKQVAGLFQSLLPVIMPVIEDLATVFVDLLNEIGPVIGEVVAGFRPLMPVIGEVAKVLAGSLGKVLKAVLPVFLQLAKVLAGAFGKTLKALQPAFLAIANAIGEAAPALGELAGALVSIIEAVAPVLPILGKLVATLVKALAPILPVIAKALGSVAKAIEPLIPVVVQVVEALGAGLGQIIEALAPALGKIVEALGQLLVALLPILMPLLKLAVILIEKIGVPVLVKIAEAIALVATALASVITWISGVVDALVKLDWSSLGEKAGAVVGAVLGFFRDLPGKVVGFVSGIPGRVAGFLGKIIETVAGLPGRVVVAAANLFGALVDEARKLPGKIGEWLGKLPGLIIDQQKAVGLAAIALGGKIIEGLGSGLSAATEFVGDIAKSVKNALVGLINDLIDLINDGIPDKLGWGRLSINIPDDPIPHLNLARGGYVPPQPGGVLANIAEAGWGEVVLSTNPAMAGRNRGLLRQSGLDAQLAGGGTMIDRSVQIDMGGVTMRTENDGRRHALEFVEGVREELWLAGAAG